MGVPLAMKQSDSIFMLINKAPMNQGCKEVEKRHDVLQQTWEGAQESPKLVLKIYF